jgi:hypothetical protein
LCPSDQKSPRTSERYKGIIEDLIKPETLFEHLFAGDRGFLVTFTAQQARFTCPDARPNELANPRQLSWRYPEQAGEVAEYLACEAQAERDTFFGVHLFREAGNRLAANALATVRALWLDLDTGSYPEEGPRPTAIIRSSKTRRHLYWRLSHPVATSWAVGVNRRLAAWAQGDTGKSGASSVLRPTGSANFKRVPEVDLVVGELTGAGPWEPEVIDQAIPELAKEEPESRGPYDGPALEVEEYLEGVEVFGEAPDELGKKWAVLCPWASEHTGGDRSGTYVGKRADGGCWFVCHHQHCQGRTWRDFKERVAPAKRRTVAVNLSPNTSEANTRRIVIRYD